MSWQYYTTIQTGRKRKRVMSGTWGGDASFSSNPDTGNVFTKFIYKGHTFTVFQPGIWEMQLAAAVPPNLDGAGQLGEANRVLIAGGFAPNLAGYIKPSDWNFYQEKTFFRRRITGILLDLDNFDYSGGGTWLFSIDVEHYYDVYLEVDDDTGAPLFPNYGGKVQSEPPYSFKRVHYEMASPGGHIIMTATYNDLAQTITADILYPFGVPFDIDVNGRPHCRRGFQRSSSSSAHCYCHFDTAMDVWGLDWNYDFTAPAPNTVVGHVNLSNGIDATVTESWTGSNDLGNNKNGWLDIYTTFSPAKRAHIKGKLFADKNPYPGKTRVTIRGDVKSDIVDVLDGEFETDVLQRFGFSVIDTCLNAGYGYHYGRQSQGISEWQGLSCYITPSANLANFEDPDDWRIGFKSLAFNAFSLFQKPGLTVDDGSALNQTDATKSMPGQWSAPKPATVTHTSNGISISIADNKNSGTASRGFRDLDSHFYGASFGGFRYLRFRIRGTAEGLPFTVKLTNQDGTKTWNIVTGAKDTFADVDIDLCNPHDKVIKTDGGQDGHDTQWPFKGDYENSRYIDSDYSGCTHVSTLALSNLQNNATYDISSISLLMKDHAKINIEPAFKNLVDEVDDDPLTKQVRVRTVMGETDGRKSLEVTDLKVDPLGVPLIGSLAGVMTDCNLSGNGWVSTISADAPYDSWHTMGLEGVHAWGGGVVFAKTDDKDPDFHVGLDLDARG